MKLRVGVLCILLLCSSVLAVYVDDAVVDALNHDLDVRVIVMIEDFGQEENSGLSVKGDFNEIRREINSRQQGVLDNLNLKKGKVERLEGEKKSGKLQAAADYDFDLKHKYQSINGFSGKVTKQGLQKLRKQAIKGVYIDKPVQINLDVALPVVSGDTAHALQVNGINMTGAGQTICIVDTGIDYTHPALGGCNPVNYSFSAVNESITPVESSHPYANDEDSTITINRTGFTNIAVHFVNISLESQGGSDTSDRVIVMDGNNQTIAVYKGNVSDIWTPYAVGDTIRIRLVTDGSVTAYGYYIDQVTNGTTNTTMNWDGCRVIDGWDFFNTDNDPFDDNGHGTHVAGIAASNNETYQGVAPESNLVAIKALNAAGTGFFSDVDAGIDWCVSKKDLLNISVISMSLGTTGTTFTAACDASYTSTVAAINAAIGAGIPVIVASGNDGSTTGIEAPACITNATSVGRSSNDDTIHSNGNRMSLLDLVAPGTSIVSTNDGGGFTTSSGTSMSTPFVAGAAAVLTQYWLEAYNVNITPSQLVAKLKNTGDLINDTGSTNLKYPRLDVLASLQPYINFTETNVVNGSTIHLTYTLVNITSDVNLSTALLEWSYSNGTVVNITMSSVTSTSWSYNITDLLPGTSTYKVYGNDSVGTFGVSEVRTLSVDNTPPEILFTTPSNNQYFSSNFSLDIYLNNSEISTTNYNITNISGDIVQSGVNNSVGVTNFTWTDNVTLGDGNYTLTVFVNDSLGNENASSVNFTVDTIAPLLFGFLISAGPIYSNSNVTLNLNVSDLNINVSSVIIESNYSGTLANYTMTQDSGEMYNYSISGGLTNRANVSYQFYATDFAGNINSSSLFSFTVTNRAPTLGNITSHINGSVIEVGVGETFTANASDLDGDPFSFVWVFGDGNSSSLSSPVHSYNMTGNFLLLVNISDGLNITSANITVVVNDTIGPTIASISYDSEVHIQSDVNQTVLTTIFDYSAVSAVSLVSNGTLRTASCNSIFTSCNWSWSLPVGSYNFTINMTDNFTALNKNSSTYSFTVTSCSDGATNGDEGGTDCGGSCATACPVAGSSGSSGGGGGGGGGSSSGSLASAETPTKPVVDEEPAKIPEQVEPVQEINYIESVEVMANEPVTINIDKKDIAIRSIEITSASGGQVNLDVKSLAELPAGIPIIENVFQYLEITADVEITKAVMTFAVSRMWLLDSGFINEAVLMNTYTEDSWVSLGTELLEVTDSEVLFQTEVSHFSYFAITGNTKVQRWYHKILPESFGIREYVLVGMLIVIIVLLIVYLVLRNND